MTPAAKTSTAKTIDLLSYFSTALPEIGLSQMCRLAGRDKATTHRHLQTLEEAGFVERNPATRRYRLGPALLALARTRESTVPRRAGAEAALAALADGTGETAHVSVLSGTTVYTLAACESPRHGTRAIIDVRTLPLHATASGLCALAFGPADLIDVAAAALHAFTPRTVDTADDLVRAVRTVRETGFARSDRGFEEEVHSLAAPVFDDSGLFAGAVSVAGVAARFTPDLDSRIRHRLISAGREITRNWGGRVPGPVEAAWAASLPPSRALETVS